MSEANSARASGCARERAIEKYVAFKEVLLGWEMSDLWDGLLLRLDSRISHIEKCEICRIDFLRKILCGLRLAVVDC